MDSLRKPISSRERAAALIIVLAFVVLLTGLTLAYFTRATSDRQVAQSSFNQSKVNQITASGMDLVIGGLRQEITGPSPIPTPPYVPATAANIVPVQWPTPTPGTTPAIPNLVRRSVRSDPIPVPGISSFASAVNSTTDVSANGRSISLARWNKHYLVPKLNTGDDKSDPITTGFSAPNYWAPDWVIVTRAPRNPADPTSPYPVAFSTWDPVLKDPTVTNNLYAVGRFAYAVYDEGQLLDVNVAGYPTGTTPDQAGRKGPVAFADLRVLPFPITNPNLLGVYQIDRLVGWRNYGTTQPSHNFPDSAPAAIAFGANFRAGSAPALAYWNWIINNTPGFTSPRSNPSPAPYPWNGRTDQIFLSRQQLIAFQKTLDTNNGIPAAGTSLFDVNALQYLTTFSRELNAPSWKPSTPTGIPAGSTFDYAFQANTPTADTSTAINRDLLKVRAVGTFTRADGTSAAAGDLLIKQRFPLSRINGLADPTFASTVNSTINNGVLVPATAGTVQRDFGLVWDPTKSSTGLRWNYYGATGSTLQTRIKRLDEVAAENREPNFFELLKAGILSGSVGMGSGSSGRTFVNAELKYYNTNPATPPTSSDYQIMQIGANIIDQWNFDNNVPTFINFNGNELAGIKNLPYLNKLVFKPAWTVIPPKGPTPTTYQFDAWLLPSLWNPHQNAPPASQNVQIAMTSGTFTASTGTTPSVTTPPLTGSATQFMTVDANLFGAAGNPSTNNPSAPTVANGIKPASLPPGITKSPDNVNYGFHVGPSQSTPNTIAPTGSTTAQPNFGAANFELQVQVSTSPVVWKAYQKWTGCAQSAPLLVCAPASWLSGTPPTGGNTTLQDPEFVTLDPRTLRFGVWGNAANQPDASAPDLTTGVLTTLETPATVYEFIPAAFTALRPHGTMFASSTLKTLYLYANNTDTTVHYTDLDGLQRQGDIISGATTAMPPLDFIDRPQILNRPFQSVAELGQVFRDQPWKTLDFGDFITTTVPSGVPGPDAGLLDIFTLHEASMEAGKTSLNTRQTPVLTAILSGATKRLADGTTTISPTQRDNIVTALVALQPMVRKTDLLTGLANNATVTGLGTKEARESVIRAFSDAGQTRTWNFLIDVIAQSGRYPTNASTLAGFLVEGEQHYWVHVAIDRFTGQVVDKQIELVNE